MAVGFNLVVVILLAKMSYRQGGTTVKIRAEYCCMKKACCNLLGTQHIEQLVNSEMSLVAFLFQEESFLSWSTMESCKPTSFIVIRAVLYSAS